MFSTTKVSISPEPTKHFENNLPKTSHRACLLYVTCPIQTKKTEVAITPDSLPLSE